jgi:ADP-ribosyl-[dinitrogen reductase] hydrolase
VIRIWIVAEHKKYIILFQMTKDESALGAVLGALVGDAAGAVLEFLGREVAGDDVERALAMPGGGTWEVAPGQITDDGELTMSLLRGLADAPDDPTPAVAARYAAWVASDPFDIGATTAASLGCLRRDAGFIALAEAEGPHVAMTRAARERCMRSKANGSLMRATPLAVWGAARDLERVLAVTRADAELSHPNPACVVSAIAYVRAIRRLILSPGDVASAIAEAREAAAEDEEVRGWLDDAVDRGVIVPFSPQDGFVKIAFSHAFRHLARGTHYEEALRVTLRGGGDTDTNACIVGGLLGARFGVGAVPATMREAVLACDTKRGRNPRPEDLHPRDVPSLVARLLC